MLVGYMRVSSESDRQTTDLQRDALLAAGVDERHLFEDKAAVRGMIGPVSPRRLSLSELVIVWWSGNWIVWAAPYRTC